MSRTARRWLLAAACMSFAAGFLVAHATLEPVPAQPNGAIEVSDEPPCPTGDGGYVGLHEGKVAVFAGEPGGCQRLVEATSIDAAQLPSFQLRELEAGVPYADSSELFQILEGLRSP